MVLFNCCSLVFADFALFVVDIRDIHIVFEKLGRKGVGPGIRSDMNLPCLPGSVVGHLAGDDVNLVLS